METEVSKRLIYLREQCGFTQNALAERAGVSQTHLRRVELGQADITVGHLQLLCDAMNISLQEFFNMEPAHDELSVAVSRLSPKQKTLLIAFLESL
jgi:transcriptional regulator with XRE-family HTH domain